MSISLPLPARSRWLGARLTYLRLHAASFSSLSLNPWLKILGIPFLDRCYGCPMRHVGLWCVLLILPSQHSFIVSCHIISHHVVSYLSGRRTKNL
ncbi:hypothetical protein VTN00DRAFT_5483 [Thermoascus crustaceus]|uniref:uncharacterized protein n=1 Tax=Thermoascus crustaceus TaxID=5088 RepID=UPI003744125C